MKILFVVNNYFATGNGLSASARRTVQALKDAGQDVRVLSGPNPDAAGWHTGTSQFALDSRLGEFFTGSGNLLKGVLTSTNRPSGTCRVLSAESTDALAAFGDFTGSTVAANTAYLAR